MSTSLLFNSMTEKDYFKFNKNKAHIIYPDNFSRFNGSLIGAVPEVLFDVDPQMMTFFSDQIKVFVTLYNGPYHFFMDTVGPLIHQYNKTPDALFIIDTSNLYEIDDKYFNLLTTTLKNKKVNFRLIKAKDMRIYADNFYVMKQSNYFYDSPNLVYDFFSDVIKDKNVKPFRKAYVSRGWMPDRTLNVKPGASFSNDNRIDNEKELEKYLSSIGFDIITPEKDFKSFEDQINYFYETKTIASLTSGGMTNACFMQPGGTMIEFVNTMVVPMGVPANEFDKSLLDVEEAIHHYYKMIAWRKDHDYIALNNQRRSAKYIIEKINNTEFLKLAMG